MRKQSGTLSDLQILWHFNPALSIFQFPFGMIQPRRIGWFKRQEGFICSHGRIKRSLQELSPFSQFADCLPAATTAITVRRPIIHRVLRTRVIAAATTGLIITVIARLRRAAITGDTLPLRAPI